MVVVYSADVWWWWWWCIMVVVMEYGGGGVWLWGMVVLVEMVYNLGWWFVVICSGVACGV